MTNSVLNVLKVFGLSGIAFAVGVSLTPILTHYLYKYKLWRKEVRQTAPDGRGTPIFAKLHEERETKVPRMGGILIWGVLLFLIYLVYFLSLTGSPFFVKLNFLSRSQTWLPLFTLVAASLLGIVDDLWQTLGKGNYLAGGMRFSWRLSLIIVIVISGAFGFFFRLETHIFFSLFLGNFFWGCFFFLFFFLERRAFFPGS